MQSVFHKDMKIGVTDSGVGGLTVVRELMRVLPNENIIYFGDNRNCPYGNKDRETLLGLAGGMLNTLNGHSPLKLAALACNTTSTFVEYLRPDFMFPIISVIEPTARAIAESEAAAVGVLATCFTAQSGCYDSSIHRLRPECRVLSEGSPHLAALIDSGRLDSPEIPQEIREHMAPLTQAGLEQVVLACTHYPIVQGLFEQLYPQIRFINPAAKQAEAVREHLERQNLLNDRTTPTFEVFTTGEPQLYLDMCERLGIRRPDAVHTL